MSQSNSIPVSRKRQRDVSTSAKKVEDTIPAPKAKRQFTAQDHKLSSVYDRLADQSQPIRVQAAKDLLGELLPATEPANPEAIDRAIRRLVRGLCSGRKAARYGFFVALTELLRQVYGAEKEVDGVVTLIGLMKIIGEATRPGGQATGQERRDHLIGRMYAIKSVIESGATFTDKNVWTNALSDVMDLAVKTPWLREECGVVLIDAIRAAAPREDSSELANVCLQMLVDKKLSRTPEGVAIWITVQTTCPKFSNFPAKGWEHDEPLHEDNRRSLFKTMREQFNQKHDDDEKDDDPNKIKGGFWQQSVHTAWEVVLARAIELSGVNSNAATEIPKKNSFVQLWNNLVDGKFLCLALTVPTNLKSDGLFEEKASAERKFWGFQLFTKMIKTAPDAVISTMFSPNFVSQLIFCLPRKNQMLHEGALEATRKLKTRAKQQPEITDKIVVGLLGKSGSLLFDRHTKSKTVEELMGFASPSAYLTVIEWLDASIMDQQDKEQAEADNERTMIADLLLSGFKAQAKESLTTSEAKSWMKRLISLLVKYAYCKPKSEALVSIQPQPPISVKSRTIFHDRLSSILGLVLSEKKEDPSKWPWYAIERLHSMTKSTKDHELALNAEKDIKKTIKKAFSIAKDMEKKASSGRSEGAILLLFSLSLLQAYSGDPDAVDLLLELNTFFGPDAEERSSEGKYDQVLEILLSFVSKPSQLFKRLAMEVFPAISGEITEEGLESLFAILKQPETLTGQGELFDKVEDVEEEEGKSDDSELDSDVEMVDGENGAGDSSDDSDSDDDDDEEELVDDDEAPDQELTEFEAKLAQALQTSKASATNGDADDSDGESMNDEDMMAIEPKLAAVFRERQKKANKPKEQKRAKENVINFKRRVLDLLKNYVKTEYASVLSLSTIIPLLELLRTTKEQALQNTAIEILKLHAATCLKAKLYPHANADTWNLLAAVHAEAHKKVNGQVGSLHGAACSRASLFLARILLKEDKKNYGRVADVYATSMKKWFSDGKVGLQATFFTEWVSWSAEVRKSTI
jgi:DNA polymerase phi